VVYHSTELAFLSIVFPSMGVMFALGGSLMAASLDKRGPRAVVGRIRRVLPPYWMLALAFVPAMLLTGLPLDWDLIYWVVPLQDPPMTWWGFGALLTLWYLREYVWFVLLSPGALWLFRRWPLPTLMAPFIILVISELHLPGVPSNEVISDLGQYFGCWLLGFAHHDGLLRRMKRRALLAVAAVLATAGVVWFTTHPDPVKGYHLGDIPIGDALWSMGFVLVLLGLAPSRTAWVDRWQPVSVAVTALNSRAMTVYLWHKAVIIGCGVLVGFQWWQLGVGAMSMWLGMIAVGVVTCVAAFGWVEDLAARRRAVLLPGVEQWRRAHTPAPLPGRRVDSARAEAGRV
jgi:hypothetical protein